MTDLLRYPVIALGPGGVDLYQNEVELTTCHRRSVRSVYSDLVLVDADLDCVSVVRYRMNNLPPRRTEQGRLLVNQVNLELELSDPQKVRLDWLRASVIDHGGPDIAAATSFAEAVVYLEAEA